MTARVRLARALALAGGTALSACVARPATAPVAPLRTSPLTALVPAAGVRWLVLARPAEWLAGPLGPALRRVVSPGDLGSLERSLGFDPRPCASLVVAGFDGTRLLLAEPVGDPATVERRFRDRMVVEGPRSEVRPGVVRIGGRGVERPEGLLLLERSAVALAYGGLGPVLVAEAYALGKLRSPSSLEAPPLAEAVRAVGDAPLRLLVPGPFETGATGGAHGLLARATAIALAARPLDGATLRVRILVLGELDDPARARQALAATWTDLATSPSGRLLGLGAARSEPRLDASATAATLEVDLPAAALADGVIAAVGARVRDIMSLPAKAAP